MNITDETYYLRGKKFIPSAGKGELVADGIPAKTDELTTAITKYERLFLLNFLSVDLYNELVSALDDLENADIKWKNLINGTDYIKDGVTYRFDGLRGFDLDSMVAFFVFCKYMENDESYYSTIGTVKGKQGSTESFAQTRKYIDAWIIFLSKYQNNEESAEFVYYLDSMDSVVGIDYFNSSSDKKGLVTLETYLEDNKGDFEGYVFRRFEQDNSLGLC